MALRKSEPFASQDCCANTGLGSQASKNKSDTSIKPAPALAVFLTNFSRFQILEVAGVAGVARETV